MATAAQAALADHVRDCGNKWRWLMGVMIAGMGSTIGLLVTLLWRHP